MLYIMPEERQSPYIHAGDVVDPHTGAAAVPLYQTSSFVFPDAATAADRYALQADGDVYTRISNPTVRALEQRLAAISGAPAAVATASGMAAFDAIVSTLCTVGDTVVAGEQLYGGTLTHLRTVAADRGIDLVLVDDGDPDAVAAALTDDVAFLHVETITNPALHVADLPALADVAHAHGVPLVVDNTFATPAVCRPVDHGADVVWESTTKWIHGAGTTVGGVLIDAGRFEWAGYPTVTDGRVDHTATSPAAPLAAAARHEVLRATGSLQAPFDAWQTLQGVATLDVRMQQQSDTAAAVAAFLAEHPAVAWVRYPGLADDPAHAVAGRVCTAAAPTRYGAMVSFGVTGGRTAARTVCESTAMIRFLANVGDVASLIIHPATTTHAALDVDAQAAAGVRPEQLRLSVGLEGADAICADLDAALAEVDA